MMSAFTMRVAYLLIGHFTICSLAEVSLTVVHGWPINGISDGQFPVVHGQITGVAANNQYVYVVDTGDRTLFGNGAMSPIPQNTPIAHDTIRILKKSNGKILHSFGKNEYKMPYGIYVDRDYIWVTDVVLNQVKQIKVTNNGVQSVILIFGPQIMTGVNLLTFCSPTDVAVEPGGSVFVADGLCNARVMQFDSSGNFMRKWGKHVSQSSPATSFSRVSSLAIVEDKVCAADSFNKLIQCFYYNGTFVKEISVPGIVSAIDYQDIFKDKLFVAYTPEGSDNAKTSVINFLTGDIVATFAPNAPDTYHKVLDIAVDPDNKDVFVTSIGPAIHKVYKFTDTQ